MITDEFLDEVARTFIPRLEDVARRWNEGNWQLPKPPEQGEYFYWTSRQMYLPVMKEKK